MVVGRRELAAEACRDLLVDPRLRGRGGVSHRRRRGIRTGTLLRGHPASGCHAGLRGNQRGGACGRQTESKAGLDRLYHRGDPVVVGSGFAIWYVAFFRF